MALFPMATGGGTSAKSLTVTTVYAITYTSYTDGNNVTLAYAASSQIPVVTNDIVNLSTKQALINCKCYTTSDGSSTTTTDYNAGDTVTINISGTRVYTFVPR